MIRVGMRLPGPFRISGGPIVTLFVLLGYVCVVMLWVTITAAVYLGLGIAHLVEMAISAQRRRSIRQTMQVLAPRRKAKNPDADRIRARYGDALGRFKAEHERRRDS
ncbi:hypothetical protein [Streptomyces sp. NPDC050548]|uniref:hypothetical protein n=1 Tax=Streptomyces sp. NPDC050548 TaxID=3365629 RepID=UPI0037A231EE